MNRWRCTLASGALLIEGGKLRAARNPARPAGLLPHLG
jgi:hypothetical protein